MRQCYERNISQSSKQKRPNDERGSGLVFVRHESYPNGCRQGESVYGDRKKLSICSGVAELSDDSGKRVDEATQGQLYYVDYGA